MARGNRLKKNDLAYRGVVYFYSEDSEGNRKLLCRHNAGTLALARLFAYMLVGEDTEKLVPTYINVYDDYDAPVLILPALIKNKHVEDGYQTTYPNELPIENYRAYFETQIGKTEIRANAAARATKVVLLDGRDITLAYIDLEKSEFKDIFDANDNLVIVWQMELIYDDIFEEVPDEYK